MSSSSNNRGGNNAPSVFSTPRKDLHYEEVLDEQDHKLVADGNRAALLHERLDSLRSLKYEIMQDDWKYQKNSAKNNATRY
jgi:hypothetical protein